MFLALGLDSINSLNQQVRSIHQHCISDLCWQRLMDLGNQVLHSLCFVRVVWIFKLATTRAESVLEEAYS